MSTKDTICLALSSIAEELEENGALELSAIMDMASAELSSDVIYSKLPFDTIVAANYNNLLRYKSANVSAIQDRADVSAQAIIQFVNTTLSAIYAAESLEDSADSLALLESFASISSEWSE